MLYFPRNSTSAIEMLMCANCLNCYQNTYNSIINGFISFQQNEGLNSIYLFKPYKHGLYVSVLGYLFSDMCL